MPVTNATLAYIGLGSNLNNPMSMLQKAIERLHSVPGCCIKQISSVYQNPPYGPIPQDDFLNAVIALSTTLSPEALLASLKEIESDLGRIPAVRWGPRCIDLDILLYGDLQYTSNTLTVPHADLTQRHFVLIPLCELDPFIIGPYPHLLSSYITPIMHSLMKKTPFKLSLCEEILIKS